MASKVKRITDALRGNASSKGSQCVYNNTGISFPIVVFLHVISNTFIKLRTKSRKQICDRVREGVMFSCNCLEENQELR